MHQFSKRLISWYAENKRDLPWRHTTDPYRVWLSEVILQQTRVDQGTAYYQRFLKLFPDVHILANAHEDEVLKAWQGLGYYSRARNLHGTAKVVSTDLKGIFPSTSAELQKLKGIGSYTSAAIASFCFNEVSPVIDGNVIRVLSRLFALDEPMDSPTGKKLLALLANEMIDRQKPAEYNQAMMEFGAVHCTPRNPSCDVCPFSLECLGLKSGDPTHFPVKLKKTSVRELWLSYFFMHDDSHTYIYRREGKGIWRGLYEFPSLEHGQGFSEEEVVTQFIDAYAVRIPFSLFGVSDEFVHLLTHRRIKAKFYELKLSGPIEELPKGWLRVSKEAIGQFGIPRLMDKYLNSHVEFTSRLA